MKSSEAVSPPERLAWQSELDSALMDIDSRLLDPRRRATDNEPQRTLPLGQIDLTSELLDEIAWRVAEQLRRMQSVPGQSPVPPPTEAGSAPVRERPRPVAVAITPPAPDMPYGSAVTIRIRKPLFRLPWPFSLFRRRRRRHPLSIRAA